MRARFHFYITKYCPGLYSRIDVLSRRALVPSILWEEQRPVNCLPPHWPKKDTAYSSYYHKGALSGRQGCVSGFWGGVWRKTQRTRPIGGHEGIPLRHEIGNAKSAEGTC